MEQQGLVWRWESGLLVLSPGHRVSTLELTSRQHFEGILTVSELIVLVTMDVPEIPGAEARQVRELRNKQASGIAAHIIGGHDVHSPTSLGTSWEPSEVEYAMTSHISLGKLNCLSVPAPILPRET